MIKYRVSSAHGTGPQTRGARRLVAALIAAVAATVIAACGSTSSSNSASGGSTGSTSSAAATGGGPKGTPIRIGAIGSYSGPTSPEYGQSKTTMQAWADWVNASGGIDGHPVQIFFADDQSGSTAGLQGAQQLINGDHVVALVGSMGTSAAAWAAYADQHKIPVIGTSGQVSAAFKPGDSNFYDTGTDLPDQFWLVMAAGKAGGGTSAGLVYCAEYAVCQQGVPLIKADAEANGLKWATAVSASATAPSLVPQCLALKAAGADVVFPQVSEPQALQLASACASQNYYPIYTSGGGDITPQWETSKEFAKSVGELDSFPTFDTSNPGVAQFQQVMKKYDPADLKNAPVTASDTWTAARLFQAGAQAAKLGTATPTTAQITAGLNSLSDVTLNGLIPPLSYKNGNRTFRCGYIISTGGGFKVLNGGKPLCAGKA